MAGMVTRLQARKPVSGRDKRNFFLFSEVSRMDLGSRESPIQYI